MIQFGLDQLECIRQWNNKNECKSGEKNLSKPPMMPTQKKGKAWHRDDAPRLSGRLPPRDPNNNTNGSNMNIRNRHSSSSFNEITETLTKHTNKHSSSIDLSGFKRESCLPPKPTYAQKCLEALEKVDSNTNVKFSLKNRFGSTQSLNISSKSEFHENLSKRSSYASSVNLKIPNGKNGRNSKDQLYNEGNNRQNRSCGYKKTSNRYMNQPRSKSKKKYQNLNAPQTPKKVEPIVLGVTNKLQMSCPVKPVEDDFIEDDLKEYLSELKLNSEFIENDQPFFNEDNLDDNEDFENKPIVDMNQVIEKLQDPKLRTSEIKSTMSGNHLKTSRAVDKLFWDFA